MGGRVEVSQLRFGVLGPMEVRLGGALLPAGPPKQRLLLAVLLCHGGQVLSTDALLDLVWDGAPPQSARANLRTYIHSLRALIGDGLVQGRGQPGYALVAEPGQVDRVQFVDLVSRGCVAVDRGDVDGGRAMLARALSLWRGRPYEDVPDLAILAADEARLCDHRLTATEYLIEADLLLGRDADLVPDLTDLVARYPYRERFAAQLMRALYRSGRQADALAVYRRARAVLTGELGVEPQAELRRLHEAMLRGEVDARLDPQQRGEVDARLDPQQRGEVDARLDPQQRGGADTVSVERPVPAQLPLDVHGFTGRRDELRHLDTIMATVGDQPTAMVVAAVSGTAGVGKSSLVVHWAHQVRQSFPDGQLYVNLRGFDPTSAPMSTDDAVRGFLDALGVPPHRSSTGSDARVSLYRSLLADRRMLIVLDNARSAEQVRPLLPGAPNSLVVITSRHLMPGLVAGEGAHPLILGLLTRADARAMLLGRLHRVPAEHPAEDEIVEACAGLPLALALAASRAATCPELPLSVLAAELRDARHRLDAFTSEDSATDLRAVLSCSYRALGPATARLFRLLGLHPGPTFTAPAAASLAGVDARSVRTLLTELTRAHLLTEHQPGRYTFHDLVRAYAADVEGTVDPEPERRRALRRLLDHYLHTGYAGHRLQDPSLDPISLDPPAPGTRPEPFAKMEEADAWFIAERTVLLALVDYAAGGGWSQHAWQLAWTMWTFLYRAGYWHDWIRIGQAAVAATQGGPDLAAGGLAQRILATAHNRLGHTTAASHHLQQALDLHVRAGDELGQAIVHHHLAAMSGRCQDDERALAHARQALALFSGIGHVGGQARTLNQIGWYLARLDDPVLAVGHCREALELNRRFGDRHGQAAVSDTLGYAFHRMGRYAAADSWFRRGVRLYRAVGDRFHEADTLEHLGDTRRAAGRYDAARNAWRQALVILDLLPDQDSARVRAKLRPATSRVVGRGSHPVRADPNPSNHR
ncbi:AfsR/SARP family transcriptional regulator [Actinoplanes sp. CA-142083]|uniref:AfsR/SARP family transcriptional regulator n=1 Tax=Actinoplanes sp. CA-142083 TaxID=3239903 RepID=UPI003D90273C